MSAPQDDATRRQVEAAAPGASVWVSANAGSGKTRVLTDRVARLLLTRCRPERILCLTYTRAAAAEMQTRLFDTLGGWALMEDAALAEALARLGEAGPFDAARLAEARRLFAAALETPGGLKIQTIHAFCAALLRRFPLEAGAPPDFAELDDRTAAQIAQVLRDRMAEAAERGEDGAFDAAADRVGDESLDALIAAVRARRGWFPEAPGPALAAAFGLAEDADLGGALGQALSGTSPDALERLAGALAGGGSNDGAAAEALRRAAARLREGDRAAASALLEGAFLTAKGAPKSMRTFPSKAVRAAAPWAEGEVAALIQAAAELRELRLAHEALAASRDLHRFADRLLAGFAAEKAARGALDFDDLVRIAAELLTEREMAAWALFKLDGGIEHILIDEAQDTSPEQWRVIRAVAEEFFAGEGARAAGRTIFAVGDEKQSIYSFQGAAPAEFARMRAHFEDRAAEAGGLRRGELAWSFRSAPPILKLVDAVFAEDAAGLSADGAPPRHFAFRAELPGLVELWPAFGKLAGADAPPWHAPLDAPQPAAPKARLADAVAAHVDALLKEGSMIPDRNGGWRPMRPGDVLILLRRRRTLAPGIIAGLKGRGVAVAGADRLKLSELIAARDLISLLRVALDREDDLAVAEVLRSPLGAVSEEGLYALAHGRRGPLMAAVLEGPDRAPEAAALFRGVLEAADYERPFELLMRALTVHGGRARLRGRPSMGPEQEDAVDELLTQALAYEAAETPTLAGFLAWLDAAEDLEVRRSLSDDGDAVRVMTVHGAKGLEAPFVVLPDTGPLKGGAADPIRLAPGGGPPLALWAAPGQGRPRTLENAKAEADAAAEEESRRLLYVALTRAETRLLICGAAEVGEAGYDACWHARIADGLRRAGAAEASAPDGLGEADRAAPMLRLAAGWEERATGAPAGTASDERSPPAPPLPPRGAVFPEGPRRPRRVGASSLGGDGDESPAGAAPAAHDRETARARGDAVHMLLELAPAIPAAERAARAGAILRAAFPALPEPLREGCAREALAALADPVAAPFLGPDALAEAGLTAELAPGLRMSGRADRVIVGPEAVRVLDWKTGPAPADPAATPERYLRQMAAYRAALRALHPGRAVEASLYWTAAGRLDVLEGAALDAALARWLAEEPGAEAGGSGPS